MQEPADRAPNVIPAEAVERRHVARGGWQRAAIGFAMGALAGLVAALVMPRDEGPQRRLTPADRPEPFPEPPSED